MPQTPEFRPGLTAEQAHHALQESIKIRDHAQQCAVLWFSDIMDRALYRELGFSTMRAYALEMLGFSKTRAGDFIHLARRLKELPAVKEQLVKGRMGYTVAREIVSVADATNQEAWVKEAQGKSRRELVVAVRRAKQEASANPNQGELMPRPTAPGPKAVVPVRVSFELTPLQYAQYEEMLASIGHRGGKAELLLDAVAALAGHTPLAGPAENTPRGVSRTQIHIHQCPTCHDAAVATPQGEVKLSATEFEAARCDAQIHESGQPNRSTIPPKMRREVLARDRYRCRRKGCHHTRHLHIHHLKPRLEGGTNEAENLITLCTQCHHLWHEKGGDLGAMLAAESTG